MTAAGEANSSPARAALEGVRVLDLSRLLPGPLATQYLADYGADVIKVEPPGDGDYLRGFAPLRNGESLFFLNLNRGKRSVVLDLKRPPGRQALRRLADSSDILIESFRPGVLAGLGLEYASLKRSNPRLIWCSVTGYGSSGPYAERAGHDVNYLAYAGLLDLNRDRSGRPVIPGFQVADIGGGALNACLGMLLALLARERTGCGQQVDAAMVDGLAPWSVYRWAYQTAATDAEQPYLSGEFPCYAVYPAADGRYLAVGALEPKFWKRLCEHLGRPDWVPLQFVAGAAGERLFRELGEVFLRKPRDAWAAELAPVDCCVAPVLELGEVETDPHWQARGLVQTLHDPVRGALRVLGFPVALGDTPGRLGCPPPRLGEHTEQVLTEAGLSAAEIAELRP